MVVGHMATFRHAGRNLNGVTQHVHIFGGGGLKGLVVDAAPLVVGHVVQPHLHGNAAGALRRHDVDDVGLHIVLKIKLQRAGFGVYRYHFVLFAILKNAGVLFGPDFFEQRPFRGDIRVAVQDQNLAARLVCLEIGSDHGGALIGAGRAAVGCYGNGQRVDAAVGHGFELAAQGHGFSAGLPGMQNLAGRIGILEASDSV